MNIRRWIKPTGITTSLALIGVLGGAPAVLSAAVTQGPFGLQGNVVSDAELAEMRGRFVEGRKVMFFGIKMQTKWLRKNSDPFDMEMKVNFDLSKSRYRPQMTMYRSRHIGDLSETSSTSTLDNVSDAASLESVSGVVQNIQVAGDSNTVHNGVEWTVTDQPTESETEIEIEGLVELVSVGTQNHTSDDGVNTQVAVESEGIGYQIDIPDVGTVTQQITRSQFSGGNILQSTQLNSDLNQVLNRIGLTVELSPAISGIRLERFHRTLDNLRGL
ncbi:hypothetical protein [Amphritea balenae]|uniref:Uncharacterized protein n=1 Tax=Amphritea balenae TaxID=452629 RepID=A0A3P1SHC7_9GAMM|nr:hypothetical protein [Amphritea balenae]RRC96681.1 hypothetical protein EHS89_20655 [Amphritea balenae]GGK84494.1 hypothetical protein GCM10007941_38760 [Amphritea balenae]